MHGIIRRASSLNTVRIDHLCRTHSGECAQLRLHYGDLTDSSNLNRLLEAIAPDEIYNLGAQSHVKVSFEVPEFTAACDAIGVLRLLDAIRETGIRTRFYQASTSELYGKAEEIPQSETTPFHPRSPYAVAKLYGFWITRNYREAYGLHASNGILFNHESPRRGETFVTRKITMAVARIHRGMQECLFMGNIDARRDWGYAPDFVRMMWKMLQQEEPGDYVVATGETHSVREFIEKSFAHVGRRIEWRGSGAEELGGCTLCLRVVCRDALRGTWEIPVELSEGEEPIELRADIRDGDKLYEDVHISLTPLCLRIDGRDEAFIGYDPSDIPALTASLEGADGPIQASEPGMDWTAPIQPVDYNDPDGGFTAIWYARSAIDTASVTAIVIGDTRIEI